MVHQERLEIGEKCFVSGIMAVLALEAGLTVITTGMHFSWVGVLLGVVGFCLILFLANRLYAGSRQAHRIALTWIGFQVVYAALALYLMASSAQGAEAARQIGAPAAWPVVLKVLAYLALGWVLVRMPTVRDFFAEKRGEAPAHDHLAEKKAVVAQEPVVPLALSAVQNEQVRGLAQYVRLVVGALIVLGVLQILASLAVYGLRSGNVQGILVLVQGLLTLALGIALGAPSNEIQPLAAAEDQTRSQLLVAFGTLLKFYKIQVVLTAILAVIMLARFATTLR
jgi:hypothetical protein